MAPSEPATTSRWRALSLDTDPKIERRQIALYKQMPAWQKVELIFDAIATEWMLGEAGVRARHPKANDAEVRYRLIALMHGEEIARRTMNRS